jgi:hypothetical protein
MIETHIHRVRSIQALPVIRLTDETGHSFTCRHLHIVTDKGLVSLVLFGERDGLQVRVVEPAAEVA